MGAIWAAARQNLDLYPSFVLETSSVCPMESSSDAVCLLSTISYLISRGLGRV